MSEPLHIQTFTLGDWATNCYVVSAGGAGAAVSGGGGECWIIDAGFEPGAMLDFIDDRDLRPTRVVLTHAHVDHIAGLWDVRRRHPDLPILIHDAERAFLTDTTLNLSAFLPEPVVAPEPTATVKHGDTLTLGDHAFEVRHTPGHSPGGITLYTPAPAPGCAPAPGSGPESGVGSKSGGGLAIVGDALFRDSIGRHDFPTSDGPTLLHSIGDQLLTLPDETRVLPGHGPETTVGRERRANPFLR